MKSDRSRLSAALVLATTALSAISLISPLAAFGEDHRERDHWHGDIHYFHEHDLSMWRTGHWFQGPHGGQNGWWWVVNGIWYFYPRRVAMIPDPYTPPAVIVNVQGAPPMGGPPGPPGMMMAAPGAVPPPPPTVAAVAPAAPANWYYCNSPHGYYPYVTNCPGGWATVPAVTTPAPPPGP